MLDYLKNLLEDLQNDNCMGIKLSLFKNYKQKVFALETAIEILTKLKNNERSVLNGNIK